MQGGPLLVEGDKEFQVCREQKMSKTLPGFSGGKLLGRNKLEEDREEEEDRGQEKKMESEVIRAIIAGVPKEADAVGVTATQSTKAGEDPELGERMV